MRLIFISTLLLFVSCEIQKTKTSIDLAKQQVLDTEKQFAELVAQKGLSEAFYHYADSNAVLQRGSMLIQGRDSIRAHYKNSNLQNISLKWEADYVDVAASADLAYTYGKYTFTAIDTSAKPVESKGIFHTVWKKQKDGSWKFVWD